MAINLQEEMMLAMPVALFKFLDTLTGTELNELEKLDARLIAKIYQAGAVFAIDTGADLGKKLREEK